MIKDQKYIQLLGVRFRNFRKKGRSLWGCSCPLCGDSQKDKNKARGFFYPYKGQMFYKCWNCNIAMPFSAFLKKIDEAMSREYYMESFKAPKTTEDEVVELINTDRPEFNTTNEDILSGLKSVDNLVEMHPVKRYVKGREIPEKNWSRMFLVLDFMNWTNKFQPGKFSSKAVELYDSPRLVFPFYDTDGKIFAWTGRSFDPKEKRKYIQIKCEDQLFPFYGLEKIDEDKRIYVVEGPLDSLFIDNSIAMAGLGGIVGLPWNDYVFVIDNDRRNKDVGRRLKRLIANDERVCIWDNTVPDGADINDLVLSGWSVDKIKKTIDRCTYSGLQAELKFNEWRKY